MKKFAEAYFSFNKPERTGIIVLLTILLLLLTVRVVMHHFVHPETDEQKEQQMVQAWEQFKKENKTKVQQVAPTRKKQEQAESAVVKADLFPFDPNTVDSVTLRRLGLKAKTTRIFLNWRRKGKIFRNKEELRKVYTLTEEEYLRLEPYIIIDNNK